jgi:hypothetical protein
MRSYRAVVLATVVSLIGSLFLASAASAAFTPGNILASVGDGLVKEFTPEGELVTTYDTGTGSITTGTTFDSSGNLFVTDFDGNAVSKFNSAGELQGSFGSGYNADPESIVIDSSGNIYVGQADGAHHVLKFDKDGNLLAEYSPETETRGTDWLALASDDCTLYYTSEGRSIKRFNVCTGEQLPDFVDNLPGPEAYQLRFLPDGGVLVADASAILRLDREGNIIQTYTTPAGQEWFNVQFAPGASTFWAGDIATGNVAEFDLNTGFVFEEFSSEPAQELAGLSVVGSPDYALKDTDGDGIPDKWEEHGLRDAEGNVVVDLPAMGADPHHKDVFVQLDAMKGLALSPSALSMVTQAFNDAPVANPDGTQGIHLHVDAGASSEMNPVTHAPWGALSQAHEGLSFQTTVGAYFGTEYDWLEFELLKHEHFAAPREPVFHYAMSVNSFDAAGHTGLSRSTPGSDFMIALGHACNPPGKCVGPVKTQAGTFMHELGHNLGLHHGGQIDENHIPNYLSVMNYSFQFTGLRTSPAGVDYSRYGDSTIPTLDENSLDETAGFGLGVPLVAASQTTLVWCPSHIFETVLMSGPVDFNCNGNAAETSVSSDIHKAAESPAPYNTKGKLVSYEDWHSLWYRGGAVGGNGLGATLPETTEDDEPPMSTLAEAADALIPPPTGSTGNASAITQSTATVHGSATPAGEQTTASFQYGTTTEYGFKTAPTDLGSAPTPTAASADLTGLAAGTAYHYQEIIETPTHVLYGADEVFSTQAAGGLPPGSTSVTPTPATEPATGVAPFIARAASCVVPRLRGKSLRKASLALRAAHCTLGRATIATAARHPKHVTLVVGRQSRRPGARLPGGARIAVVMTLPSRGRHQGRQ